MRGFSVVVPVLAMALGVFAPPAHGHLGFDDQLRIYVLVVQGLNPDEIGASTPSLEALREQGTWYEGARAVLVADAIPNHVAMMTGVLPRRSGIVADRFLAATGPARTMDDPALLEVDTLVTRLGPGGACGSRVTTAVVMPTPALHRIFGAGGAQSQADVHQQSQPVLPVTDHAPDLMTMQDFLNFAMYRETPHVGFASFADVERSGRVDAGGLAGAAPVRAAVLAHTDAEIGLFVEMLELLNVWSSTILFVVSDRGTDWAAPTDAIDVGAALAAGGFAPGGEAGDGDFVVVPQGGAALVYVNESADVAAIAALAAAVPGVERVLTGSALADAGLDHANGGDLVVLAAPGRRFGGEPASVPYPGIGGGPAAQTVVLLVAGGHPALVDSALRVPASAGPVGPTSIAATIAALLSLDPSAGGYDGRLLTEAFDAEIFVPGPGVCRPNG